MSNKSEKKYRKIKKSHIWNSIVEFILFSIVSAFVVEYGLYLFGSYIIDTKIAAEYEKIHYMSKLYERSLAEEDENIFFLLLDEGRDFLITDQNGNIVRSNGVDTRGAESGSVHLPGQDAPVLVYRDGKRGFIHPAKGRLTLDYPAFFRWMSSDEDLEEKETEDIADRNIRLINLPVWISIDLGQEGAFVGKAVFSTDKRDVTMFTTLVISLIALLGIILCTILFAGIRNFVRQKRMVSLFFTDVVTDGHNHTWLLVKGERMLRKKCSAKNRFALINLQFVNYSTFCICHSVKDGEKVLCTIYRQINGLLKRDEMVAHLGSGEFGIILKYMDDASLRTRLGGLIGELEALDTAHKFYFRAGVVMIDRLTDKNGNPVQRKEIDLDTAGNNAVAARLSLGSGEESGIAFFDDKMVKEQQWIDQVQERQQTALEKEEFVVYYQPKYDPKTDTLRGAEALIRWNYPNLGLISPGRFIPIFERNGFITEIDHYMIRHVAADQKTWLDQGKNCVPVSVNVSRAHFIESDLAEQIRDMVDEIGTPHEYIEIELTESAFFDDKKAMLHTISKLKEYGFAVSMDDFGSGYSSLNSLKDLPLDVLKLDAEFFRGENAGRRGEIVVAEAIRLGKKLNMRIVAEGVEVRDQVDFLADEGCDMIQGFIFAKPMPKDDFEKRMGAPAPQPAVPEA
ncbi:MAG: EAL domain-containing protein [Lachnospiraceae bacterium]|nr:EAL domain-containing protein [Lachnospiraceae bacterium]